MLLYFKSEREWLEARKQDVTSTEVAALFGLHPYKSRLTLWHEKAGNIENDFVDSDPARWGRRLQTAVGIGICEDEGWDGQDMTGFYMRNPDIRLGCSLDIKALRATDKKHGILEIKVAESFDEAQGWSPTRAPLQYEFQLLTQLNLAQVDMPEIQWGCIGTLGRRQKTQLYHRLYDGKTGKLIEEECESFWRSIADGKPPAPDYTVDGELLERLRPALMPHDVRIFNTGDRAHDLAQEYALLKDDADVLKAQAKPLRDRMKVIQTELLDLIGRNSKAIVGAFEIGAGMQVREERWDHGSSFRRFDFKKRRKR